MRFSGSKALSESFAIFGERFGPMAIVAGVFIFVPLLIFMGFFASQLPTMASAGGDPTAMIAMIGGMIGKLALVFLIYGLLRVLGSLALCIAADDRQGKSVGATISEAAGSLLPMVGVAVLLFIAYLVLAFVLVIAFGASMGGMLSGNSAPDAGAGLTIVLMVLGLFVLIIWLAVKLSMILPVIALGKERNPVNAIARSWALTKGSSLKIFLVFLLAAICSAVINGVVNAVTGQSMAGMANGDLTGIGLALIVSVIIGTMFAMYFTALIVAIYRQLAGPSTGEVSKTFA